MKVLVTTSADGPGPAATESCSLPDVMPSCAAVLAPSSPTATSCASPPTSQPHGSRSTGSFPTLAIQEGTPIRLASPTISLP